MLLNKAIICITGARGTGKTLLASTYAKPSELKGVFYHDSERSANRVRQSLQAQGLDFGYYGDLQDQFGDLPSDDDLLTRISKGSIPWVNRAERSAMAQYYSYILEDIEKNLKRDKYKVYVLDTIEKFESGMVAWVEEHQKETGAKGTSFATRGGQFWWGAYYPLYEGIFSAILGRGVETIILCSHLKNAWHGNKPVPGKVDISGKPLLFKLASLMLWLVNDYRNPTGAPAGLVLKERLVNLTFANDSWEPRRMLPARIPCCTWSEIARYLHDGCDMSNPGLGEKLSKAEREMIDELLTDEQMKLMVLDAEKELEEARGQVIVNAPLVNLDLDKELVEKEKEKIKGLGVKVTEENKQKVEEQLFIMRPPPLRNEKAKELIQRAIEELIGE